MMRELLLWILGLFVVTLEAFPHVTDSSLVVSSTTPKANTSKEANNEQYFIPKIYEMRIDCNVSNRFAKSLITSKVKNLDKAAHEAVFSVVIPDQAFISGFVMEINGKSYEAYVQEKEEAKNTYKAAVDSGLSAGHVAVSARDSHRFTVSVNIEPQSKVTFYLKYEELLKRVEDKYQIVMNIHPGQPVPHLEAKVHIAESRPLKFVRTPSLKTGNEIEKEEDESLSPNAQIENINKTSAEVTFSPNVEKQKQYANALGTKEDEGLAGQFVVEYDVERDPQGGEVLVDNGYFVHFFGTDDLQPLPKQVVFVLDTSGSMGGIRITQLKEAMKSILSELKEEDVFNIVEFNSKVKVWNVEAVAVQYESETPSYWGSNDRDAENPFKNRTEQPLPPAYPANEKLIRKAEQVVEKLYAYGGTDIEIALKTAIQLVGKNLKDDKKHQPIVIFLTDGEATLGEVDNEEIIRTISELNIGETPIFSLSFGDGADRKFLEKISLKNFGFARHIYEGADASLQLKKFYKQISSPLLSNVTFNYVSNVTSVTKRQFPILFGGSELVVAGIADENEFNSATVEGWGIKGPVVLRPKVETAVSSIERLWAYLTLKQILEQREREDNKTGTTQDALRIAIKYSFVSDVSSLVVVKPNKTDAVETEDGSKSDKYGYDAIPQSVSSILEYEDNDGIYATFPSVMSQSEVASEVDLAVEEQEPTTQLAITVPNEPSLDKLIQQLPWLISILNKNNTVNLSSDLPVAFGSGGGGYVSGHGMPVQIKPTRITGGALNYQPLFLSGFGNQVSLHRDNIFLTHYLPTGTKGGTEVTVDDEIHYLKKKLPWFNSVLNSNNTISLPSGTFNLGLNTTTSQECDNSLSNNPGECVLIYKCPQIFAQIQNVDEYEEHFCSLQGYAGVCCPKDPSVP